MDDVLVSFAQFPTVAAALFGQHWIDEHYDRGSWKHRYYTAFLLLFDRQRSAWQVHYEAHVLPVIWPEAKLPSTDRLREMRIQLGIILGELGLE